MSALARGTMHGLLPAAQPGGHGARFLAACLVSYCGAGAAAWPAAFLLPGHAPWLTASLAGALFAHLLAAGLRRRQRSS